MTTWDISEHLNEPYLGVEISPTLISNFTERVLEHVTEWQARPLENLYPIIFFDAIHYKVREDHKIQSKAASKKYWEFMSARVGEHRSG
jgi:putative transposase